MEALLQSALKSAPFLVICLGGIYTIMKLLLRHFEQAEEQRLESAEQRHQVYFKQLDDMSARTDKVVEKNTEMIGRAIQVMDTPRHGRRTA